jgi:hypothetical protein
VGSTKEGESQKRERMGYVVLEIKLKAQRIMSVIRKVLREFVLKVTLLP